MNDSKRSPKVVSWKEYFPDLDSASHEIKTFYHKWKASLHNGIPIDIEDNSSYLFAYLYESISDFLITKDIHKLEVDFSYIFLNYPNGTIINHANDWLEDAYVYVEDYKRAFNISINKNYKRVEEILFYSSKIGSEFVLTGKIFIDILGDLILTDFGRSNINDIIKLLDIFLIEFQIENNANFFQYFTNTLNCKNISEREIEGFKRFYLKESDFYKYKEIDNNQILSGYKTGYINPYKKTLFQGVVSHQKRTIGNVGGICVNINFLSHSMIELETNIMELGHVLKNALLNEGRRILRETENTFREESGVPKIGEGWISETELFQKLKKTFSKHKVVHHGRPNWLGKQHIDIYFPDLNIGVEYQGLQHLQPVSFFGGESSFKIQQDLDKKKKLKCLKNGCKLIYVFEGYDFDDVIEIIESLIQEPINN